MNLIFVYNAGSGFFNLATDIAHKIFSPATYPCSLCDLTHGVFKIKPEWEAFVKNTRVPFVFLYKDEFQRTYPAWREAALPLVLVEKNGHLEVLIAADELRELASVSNLKKLVLEKVEGR